MTIKVEVSLSLAAATDDAPSSFSFEIEVYDCEMFEMVSIDPEICPLAGKFLEF